MPNMSMRLHDNQSYLSRVRDLAFRSGLEDVVAALSKPDENSTKAYLMTVDSNTTKMPTLSTHQLKLSLLSMRITMIFATASASSKIYHQSILKFWDRHGTLTLDFSSNMLPIQDAEISGKPIVSSPLPTGKNSLISMGSSSTMA
jgi:hypothetical protein